MQHGGVLVSVLCMEEHKCTHRTTEGLHPVLRSVFITRSLLLFTILQLYFVIKTTLLY
jgi:hypothetical protein